MSTPLTVPVEVIIIKEKIQKKLANLDINPNDIDIFLSIDRAAKNEEDKVINNYGLKVLQKIHDNIPGFLSKQLTRNGEKVQEELTIEQQKTRLKEWRELPKTIQTLQTIKFPTLCGWSTDEICEVLKTYIFKNTKNYHTERCNREDCLHNGVVGIMTALRTDVGMSPFNQHAFHQIRTNVRRPSINAGVIKTTEKAPSKVRVRRVITEFLLKKKVITESNLIEIFVQKKGYGSNTLKEKMVPLCCELSDFCPTAELREELIKHLNSTFFNPLKMNKKSAHDNTFEKSYKIVDNENIETIEDLIKHAAINPDFHGNPLAMSTPVSEEHTIIDSIADKRIKSPFKIAEYNDVRKKLYDVVNEVYNDMHLTFEQRVVLKYRYGLDGVEMMTGSDIARSFGKLKIIEATKQGISTEKYDKDQTVSRFRITQYEKILKEKTVEYIFDILFTGDDGTKKLEHAIQEDGITTDDKVIMSFIYGLNNVDVHDEQWVADNYEMISSDVTADNFTQPTRDIYVKEKIKNIKAKVVEKVLTA